MLSHTVTTAISAAERGLLPDFVCRSGIRQLLRRRLADVSRGGPEQQIDDMENFVATCCRGPVAVETDAANEQHYEVPPEFFHRVLGPQLKYSCCQWDADVSSLADAESRALQTTCARADLNDGNRILELGCGWGSLTLFMAEQFPNSEICAVSNSHRQRDWILKQANERQLKNVHVITSDINDFSPTGSFDRVVSVEMFEHMRNHRELLRQIASWLADQGKLFVHLFCHKQMSWFFEPQGPADWMSQHFFTGGMMPSDSLLLRYQQHLQLQRQWRWNGRHYAMTCNAWLHRMDQHREEIQRLFEQCHSSGDAAGLFHRWRIFFMACAELFAFNNGQEWWVSHYLFEKTAE